eukprot:TRINITY_DN5908_c0_g1_i1.p1 TRINITY_DN5908_c0_g1~~TRINITY_DN5908_c0_g1_i1.p1  ORF type:complete len:664 (-),score=200.33 TRINITY_DN5908_c0_g1_i1:1520-3511(-)
MMKFGLFFIAWCLLGAQLTLQQATSQDEVTLDPQGISLADFESQAEQLGEKIFSDLASASQADLSSLQEVAAEFAKNLGLSVANVVIYINNQGVEDAESQSQDVASAVESAFAAAIQSSGPEFLSFNTDGIVDTIQESVSSVLEQLMKGVGINEVINEVANSVLEASFNAVIAYLQQPSTSTATSSTPTSTSTASSVSTGGSTTTTATTVEDSSTATATATASATATATATATPPAVVGQFTFSAEGRTTKELQDEITAQAEAGFTAIESSDETSVQIAVSNLAVNITQIIGNVLFSVLSAGDDVDKETEVEAITAAISSSLSVAVANANGDLQKLDVDSVESEIAGVLFVAVSEAEAPDANLDQIMQTAASDMLVIIGNALGTALGATVSGSVEVEYAATTTPGTAKATTTTSSIATSAASAPTVAGVGEVSSMNTVTLEQIQSNLSTAFEAAFTGVEEDPQNPETQQLLSDLVIEIASSIGNALLSLALPDDAQAQTQTIVSLFQDALETAVSKSKGPIGDFDIAGVVQSIESAAEQSFSSSGSTDIQTQVQVLASSIIDIIIEQLGEVIPGFAFEGELTVTGTTTVVNIPTVESVSTMAVSQADQAGSFNIMSSSSTTSVEDVEPASPEPATGECLCLDEEMLNALIDARVEQKLAEISP